MDDLNLPLRVATDSGDDGSIEDVNGNIIARVVDNVPGSKRHINRLHTARAIKAACNAHEKLVTENAQRHETLARADAGAIRDAALEEIAAWHSEKGWLLDEEDVSKAILSMKFGPKAPACVEAKGDAK